MSIFIFWQSSLIYKIEIYQFLKFTKFKFTDTNFISRQSKLFLPRKSIWKYSKVNVRILAMATIYTKSVSLKPSILSSFAFRKIFDPSSVCGFRLSIDAPQFAFFFFRVMEWIVTMCGGRCCSNSCPRPWIVLWYSIVFGICLFWRRVQQVQRDVPGRAPVRLLFGFSSTQN